MAFIYIYIYIHTHTMKYCSAFKKKEILTHVTTWMKLEDIMLSEISQSKKGQILYDLTHLRYLELKFIETESRMVVARG